MDDFAYFYTCFHRLWTELENKANPWPFVHRCVRPTCFTRPIISDNPHIQEDNDVIWSNFLSCQLFSMGFPRVDTLSIILHVPNYDARQIGFSQAILAPFYLESNLQICDTEASFFKNLKYFFQESEKRRSQYCPIVVDLSNFKTSSFRQW